MSCASLIWHRPVYFAFKIFYAPRESQARAALHELKAKWGQSFPSAVAVIEKDFDALLRFFQFDPTYWTVLRTTHPIERLNKELKRRTRAMEVTGGEISRRLWPANVEGTLQMPCCKPIHTFFRLSLD